MMRKSAQKLPSACLNSTVGSTFPLGSKKQLLWPVLKSQKFKNNQGRKKPSDGWMPPLSRNQVEAAVREENTYWGKLPAPAQFPGGAGTQWVLGAGRGKGDLGLMEEGAFTEPERANQIERLYCPSLSGALSQSISRSVPTTLGPVVLLFLKDSPFDPILHPSDPTVTPVTPPFIPVIPPLITVIPIIIPVTPPFIQVTSPFILVTSPFILVIPSFIPTIPPSKPMIPPLSQMTLAALSCCGAKKSPESSFCYLGSYSMGTSCLSIIDFNLSSSH